MQELWHGVHARSDGGACPPAPGACLLANKQGTLSCRLQLQIPCCIHTHAYAHPPCMHRHTLTIHAATQLQLARQKHNAISPPAITAAIESSLHGMPVRPRELLHGSDRTRTLPRRRPSTSTQPAAGTTTGAVNTPPIRMAIYLSIHLVVLSISSSICPSRAPLMAPGHIPHPRHASHALAH